MKYQAIIFDVGDTLLENCPSEKQIFVDRIKCLNFEVDDQLAVAIANAIMEVANEQIQKEQKGVSRMSDEDFVAMQDKAALSCVKTNKDETEMLKILSRIPLPKQELKIIPGTMEVLQTLRDRGFRLGIVSNHRAWLLDFLEEIGLSAFFETIIISDIVGVEKPDVRIMQIALDRLLLDASSCLYVGDHPLDVLCSKNAGIDCVWLTSVCSILPNSVPCKEDYRIEKLQDLIEIV